MSEVILAIDQGTQSSRVFLYDKNQQVVASAQRALPQIYPHAGWCEHDPLTIYSTVQECIAEALEGAPAGTKVLGVGVTNQRETTVVWSKSTGKPLHNAVVWLDTRTAALCEQMTSDLGKDHFRSITGLPISTYFSAFKLRWLLDEVEQVRAAVADDDALFGTVDTWLIYNLTGGATGGGAHVTDVTNAARTFLMDLGTGRWSLPLLQLFGATERMMPRIVSCAETVGVVASGPLAGVPVCGVLGDQHAALLGQRARPGHCKSTYGTGGFLLLNTGPTAVPSAHGLLTTVAFQLGPDRPVEYALEGAIAIAGAGVTWLRDGLGIIGSAQESESIAASVPDSAGVYFVPAFNGLLAPHWRDDARGVIVGLTQYSTKAHIVRALLEAVALQVYDCVAAMRRDCRQAHFELHFKGLRVDGGMTQNNLLLQLQADILHAPVLRPRHQETTSLGAALAAGLALGFYTEGEVFEGEHREGDVEFAPHLEGAKREALIRGWRRAVGKSLGLAGPVTEDALGLGAVGGSALSLGSSGALGDTVTEHEAQAAQAQAQAP